jgi:signal transduction histidine kinase
LTVHSVPGEGTTMSVVLPVAANSSEAQTVRVE